MDRTVRYVYPNTSDSNRGGRGGLSSRYVLAQKYGCEFIEMPADFIKNKTEVALTGLDLGSVLTSDAVSTLYEEGTPSSELSYILHSEPSLPRSDGYGLTHQAALCWYRKEWVCQLSEMLLRVSHHLSLPPLAIEIHPGDRRNSADHLLDAIRILQDSFQREFDATPVILLENRTEQFVSTGSELARFARELGNCDDLNRNAGIVLDIQQLFTRTRENFISELEPIPLASVKGLHIHAKHRTPSETDPIPWRDVFRWIGEIPGDIIINPEVHHRKQVEETIMFCNSMMN